MEIAAICIAIVLVLIFVRLHKMQDHINEIMRAQSTLLLLATNSVPPDTKQQLSARLSKMFNVVVPPEND